MEPTPQKNADDMQILLDKDWERWKRRFVELRRQQETEDEKAWKKERKRMELEISQLRAEVETNAQAEMARLKEEQDLKNAGYNSCGGQNSATIALSDPSGSTSICTSSACFSQKAPIQPHR